MARCGARGAGPQGPPGACKRGVAERRRLRALVSEQLSQDLLRLLREEIHTDVTFCIGPTLFKAHKAVLLARVPDFYFYTVGKTLNNWENHVPVAVENFEPSEFRTFLHFLLLPKYRKQYSKYNMDHLQNNFIHVGTVTYHPGLLKNSENSGLKWNLPCCYRILKGNSKIIKKRIQETRTLMGVGD